MKTYLVDYTRRDPTALNSNLPWVYVAKSDGTIVYHSFYTSSKNKSRAAQQARKLLFRKLNMEVGDSR